MRDTILLRVCVCHLTGRIVGRSASDRWNLRNLSLDCIEARWFEGAYIIAKRSGFIMMMDRTATPTDTLTPKEASLLGHARYYASRSKQTLFTLVYGLMAA